MRLIIATKSAEPMIDQMMGNPLPFIRTESNSSKSGNPSLCANSVPSSAPMNPSAIETRQPPRLYPAMACPIAPQIPATKKRISHDIKSILRSLSPLQSAKLMPAMQLKAGYSVFNGLPVITAHNIK
jgi:hypothetical protein